MSRLTFTGLAAVLQFLFFSGVLLLTGAEAAPGACLLVLVTSWTVLESAFQHLHCGAAGRRETGGPRETLYGIALFVTLTLCTIGPLQATIFNTTHLPLVLGTAIGFTGIALRLAAIACLGPYFHNDVEIAPGQPHVANGIYRFLRHPGELGNILAVTGACTLSSNPTAAAFAALVFLPFILDRVRREDRLLRIHFNNL